MVVQSCQREAIDESKLFAHSLDQLAVPAAAGGGVALVFDERMQLHAECRARPHPERPDRIKAVIARLMSSGLAGAHASCSATQPGHCLPAEARPCSE